MTMRVEHHPVLGSLENKQPFTFYFNGETYEGYEGDSIASALLAAGVRTLRQHEASGTGRGIYCNIGHCFECRVQLEDRKVVRACLTPVKEGMVIHSVPGYKKGGE
ncbi:(2Fe-2S)-binding protein [Bacillus inaquosorum]|uniref:(2Fe-2S)-binding protein n=1 Tax=Bacillus inaquosorum TaxID=483913 RepID=UPI002E0CF188|nr:(2Fe-2S)-binding protein [Bacillus inaquosorum]MED1196500.1 (2Fe-2S)-binding protein [Bacillus inaquosorum]MED1222780.1 (2Fe-2S)-binding protein [Bacillus inaquosorum]